MIFTLKDPEVSEGTVLLFGVRYGASTSGTIYTFAGLKAGGRWYFTGTGPSDASWSAVQRWLQRDRREVVWVKAVTGMELIWENEGAAKTWADQREKTWGRPVLSTLGADELLDQVTESTSRETFDDHGVDPYGN